MKIKIDFFLWLFRSSLLAVFFLCACQSITNIKIDPDLPPFTVIFSFDDGPNNHGDTTARLLDVLKKYEIKAFFSLLGERAEAHPELVRRIHDEGHYIINHGYSDKWANKMKDDEFRNNLVSGGTAIFSALGKEINPKLYRPHIGFYTSRQEKICIEEGYTIIPGNIRVYDAVNTKAKQDKVIDQVINKTIKQGGGIILLHDARDSISSAEEGLKKDPYGAYNRSWIPEATEKIIEALLEKGFTIGSPAQVVQ